MAARRLPDQLSNYLEFCSYRRQGEQSGGVDLRDCRFIYPTTLLPLIASVAKYRWHLQIDSETNAGGYLEYILGRKSSSSGRTYVAPVRLPEDQEEAEEMLKTVYALLRRSDLFSGNETALRYVIAELVDNVYEHSMFSYSYVMAQRYEARRFIELCFFDDGVTIPGSFEASGHKYSQRNHWRAISDAIRGASTKREGGRGFGLSSNVEMFRDAGGEVLIVSGFGAVYVHKGGVMAYRLTQKNEMDGTLISLRARDRSRTLNIYEYLERETSLEGAKNHETEL